MTINDILSLVRPPKLSGIKKILCVQPHPDDNEIGMGGIIAKFVSDGVQVDYLTVTDGSLGDIGLTDGTRSLADIRAEETRAAGRYLGATDFIDLGYKDGSLNNVPELAGRIAEILRRGKYDAVACPDPWNHYEAHNDHIVTGFAAAQAAISCNLLHYPEGSETEPTEIKAVLFYFSSKPNTRVNITKFFNKKMEAVALHKSQIDSATLGMYTVYFSLRGRRLPFIWRKHEGVKALTPLHLHCFPESKFI